MNPTMLHDGILNNPVQVTMIAFCVLVQKACLVKKYFLSTLSCVLVGKVLLYLLSQHSLTLGEDDTDAMFWVKHMTNSESLD